MYYVSNNGTGDLPGSGDNITSGAYVFRPVNGSAAVNIEETGFGGLDSKVMYTKGDTMVEIIQQFGKYIVQTLRYIVEGELEYIEYDWVVGPLNNKTV